MSAEYFDGLCACGHWHESRISRQPVFRRNMEQEIVAIRFIRLKCALCPCDTYRQAVAILADETFWKDLDGCTHPV